MYKQNKKKTGPLVQKGNILLEQNIKLARRTIGPIGHHSLSQAQPAARTQNHLHTKTLIQITRAKNTQDNRWTN